jgi:microsomal dipeptidase-like Zn-dependent dipeptidase
VRSVISETVDRVLHTTAIAAPKVDAEVASFHAAVPVVDLVVGTALFRAEFLRPRGRGHADLPRLVDGGVDLVGFTIATRHPDLRGTLSTPHFWSLGLPVSTLRSDGAIAEALMGRIEGWAARSGGRLRMVRTASDLVGIVPGGPLVRAFIGIQGGHVLEGDAGNVERLHRLGVRMLAPAHVMDNALVGSNTGARRDGLTGFGREVVAELEHRGIVIDLAHMSRRGIDDTLPLLSRPFVLSHTGFTRVSGAGSRVPGRRFTPRNRNVGDREAQAVAEAGGVVGLTLSTLLLGGQGLDAVRRSFDVGLELCGPDRLALGSDFDGGLRMVTDSRGLPAVTGALLAGGHDRATVATFLGGNALRVLRGVTA